MFILPTLDPLVSDERLAQLGYRMVKVKNYIIFYAINEDHQVVDIERARYARRDWMRIL